MLVNRNVFFAVIFLVLLTALSAGKINWLIHSRKTEAVFLMEQRGDALKQIQITHSILYYKLGKDTIWFEGPLNLHAETGDKIPARYNPAKPSEVKVNTFFGIWGETAVYAGFPCLVLLVLTLHPSIIPYHAKLRLTARKPFIQIV